MSKKNFFTSIKVFVFTASARVFKLQNFGLQTWILHTWIRLWLIFWVDRNTFEKTSIFPLKTIELKTQNKNNTRKTQNANPDECSQMWEVILPQLFDYCTDLNIILIMYSFLLLQWSIIQNKTVIPDIQMVIVKCNMIANIHQKWVKFQ